MNLNAYIQDHLDREDYDALFEAFGPDAWPQHNAVIHAVTQAILSNQPDKLMEAVREPFMDYMKASAEYHDIGLEPQDEEDELRLRYTERSSLDPFL